MILNGSLKKLNTFYIIIHPTNVYYSTFSNTPPSAVIHAAARVWTALVASPTWICSPRMNSVAAYKHENRKLKTDAKWQSIIRFVYICVKWHILTLIQYDKKNYAKFELTYIQYVKVVLSLEWKCEFRNHIEYTKYNN